MNFFSKLFGLKREQNSSTPPRIKKKQIEPKRGNPFFTNAPIHWGIITDEFLESNTDFTQNFDEKRDDIIADKRMFMVNSLVLLGNINQNLSEKVGKKIISSYAEGLLDSKEQYATSCAIHKLLDKGIIRTNGIVIDNYEKYAVFLFTRPTSMTFIHRLREKFIENDFKDLIYYCIENPDMVNESASVALPYIGLQKESLKLKSDQSRAQRKYNDYALWWTKNPNIIFSDTFTYKILSEYNEHCYDCNTYLLGKIGYALGLNENDKRVKMPDYDELIIEGPEDVEIIMTLSQKTGINFHFPASPLFEKYRDNFINSFVALAISIKEQVLENNFDRDIDFIRPEWLEQAKNIKNIESISLILSDKMFINELNLNYS
ncbi:MAG: hypothetical protein JNM21_05885 [Taibaiella sp.]|nr:hypothetical protein [Taibaiella sp.]